MKRYEGLFILNTAGKEEGIKDMIDRITGEVVAVGGKVETVQKMEKRAFARVSDKKINGGFYVNVIFEAEASAIRQLRSKFVLNDDVFRVLFSNAPMPKAPSAA